MYFANLDFPSVELKIYSNPPPQFDLEDLSKPIWNGSIIIFLASYWLAAGFPEDRQPSNFFAKSPATTASEAQWNLCLMHTFFSWDKIQASILSPVSPC